MVRSMRWAPVAMIAAAICSVGAVSAQEAPKPGKEHEYLKKYVGEYDCEMEMADGSKSTLGANYKLDESGFHLHSEVKGDLGGMKFVGRGVDSYCPARKKYVASWTDSMSPGPMHLYGTMSDDGKVLTLTGDGAGMDGKLVTYKSTSEWKNDDSLLFVMYNVIDGKDVKIFTITYKRKKA